jgi:serine/threonine protein kinase
LNHLAVARPPFCSNEFVRSDQLLSWIVAHVTPSPGSASTLRSGGSNATAATVAPTTPPAAVALGAPSFGAPLSRHRHSSSSDVHSPRIADIQPFELNFWDLTMERSIGRGSFGKVYLASWHETPVAVKLLMQLDGTHQPSCGGTPGPSAEDSGSGPPADEEAAVTLSSPAMARFYKEAQLMAAMRHPNVISLLGFCVKPPALVTEYCARGSLTDVLREAATDGEKAARLTWQLRLHMALDAAKGMLALHSHSPVVLHRDLKGPNLLVDFSWRVKVTDFGLSKIVEEGLSMQSTQSPVNPRWLAPEILAGARATTASDVFSYGVILYELLTWTVPWGGADFWEIVSALTRGERLPIPDRASLPGPDTLRFAGLAGYIVLMQRCWAQEPTQRPDFEEIVQCLRRLLEEAPA